jgi:hypothetical protein
MTTAQKTAALVLVELRANDPEATSALQVARARLAAGSALASLRRFRLFELKGELPSRDELETRMHHSTQFWNPSKERGTLLGESSAGPFGAGEVVLLVTERGGERRPAAERWWRHDGGARIEVREGVVWAMRWEDGVADEGRAESLAVTTSSETGLLCNPHAQDWRLLAAGEALPADWISRRSATRTVRARKGSGS